MNQEPSTGVRKRQQIASTNKQMMFYVAGAAAIVTICVMLAINLSSRISYLMKVNAEWSTTNESLKNSISSIPGLRKEVEALSANTNVKSIEELVDPSLEKWQVVFDVLPSSCDKLAVEYSFTNIIFKKSHMGAGVKDAIAQTDGFTCGAIVSLEGGESATADTDSLMRPQSVTMRVDFELTNATDEDIRKALLSLEYSLHPVTIKRIEITRNNSDDIGAGNDNTLSAKISAVTYFVPKADWQPGKKTIPVDENADPTTKEEAK